MLFSCRYSNVLGKKLISICCHVEFIVSQDINYFGRGKSFGISIFDGSRYGNCSVKSTFIQGFKHTAFVFHGESLLHRSPNLVQSDMPPGSLVTLLQKALLFLYVETHVSNV